jgi:methionine synthase II (cobalamin-independent)
MKNQVSDKIKMKNFIKAFTYNLNDIESEIGNIHCSSDVDDINLETSDEAYEMRMYAESIQYSASILVKNIDVVIEILERKEKLSSPVRKKGRGN